MMVTYYGKLEYCWKFGGGDSSCPAVDSRHGSKETVVP